MSNCRKYIYLILLCLITGCTGLRFGPGFSMTNTDYFMEPPHVVLSEDGYKLRWRYGTMGFFFQPSSKVVAGRLLFSLQVTSSSGDLSGRYGELLITGSRQVHALETGGVFWLEPDGRKIPIKADKP